LEGESVECRHEEIALGGSIGCAVVHLVARVDGRCSLGIDVWAVDMLGAETAHDVALLGGESAIGHEEIIVFANALDVGTFARHVVASSNALAKVWVAGGTVVAIGGVRIGDGVVA